MATYMQYQLDDQTTILIAIDEDDIAGLRPTSSTAKTVLLKAEKTFSEALGSIKSSAAALRQSLEDAAADEVTVTFGLVATGDIGNFAIGSIGVKANYIVKLKWKNMVSDNQSRP